MILADGLIAAGDPDSSWFIGPQGDRSVLLIRESNGLPDVQIGRQCARIAAVLRDAAIPGVSDIVPAFNTVALHFQPRLFGAGPNFKSLVTQIRSALETVLNASDTSNNTRTIEIPVCYGGEHGPDLDDVARHCGLSPEEVIQLHSSNSAYVFMLGFAPGAPYIGVHDQRLDIVRRSTPRVRLPAGSVAMANRQTIIYPQASPGGWHVIGATPVRMFNPETQPPTLLSVGDNIQFVPITPAEFQALQAKQL